MRTYDVSFEQVAVTAAQDLVTILGAAGKICRIKRVRVSATDTSIPTAQMLSLRERYLPVTVTAGAGGSTPTPRQLDPGDAAASVTAHANDTTKTTTNGTALVVNEIGCHIYAGYDYTYPPDARPIVGPSEAFVFELLSTVSGTVHLSGGVTVEEMGG
jgi:hypothetical protein